MAGLAAALMGVVALCVAGAVVLFFAIMTSAPLDTEAPSTSLTGVLVGVGLVEFVLCIPVVVLAATGRPAAAILVAALGVALPFAPLVAANVLS